MAARGTEEKDFVIKELEKVFPNMFFDGKAYRIPVNEVEIKVTLACAKDVLGGSINSTPTETKTSAPISSEAPTELEKKQVKDLLNSLGL